MRKYAKSSRRSHGSQGAASPVRHIDPKTGEVIAAERSDRPKEHDGKQNSKAQSNTVRVPLTEDDGPPCPRCHQPTEIREHKAITAKQLAQPFYYSRWFKCLNGSCHTTLIMPEEFKVYRDSGVGIVEPAPYRDIALDVLDEMNRTRRTFGEFTRAYYQQCAQEGIDPECPF